MNKVVTLLRKYIRGIVTLAAFGVAIYAPVALQNGTITLPTLTSSQQVAAENMITISSKPKPAPKHGDQALSYDFSRKPNAALSPLDWNFENGTMVSDYNQEAQAYTSRRTNVRVENGLLIIEAQPEQYAGKAYTSARVDTKNKFDFMYGTLEVDMKLPTGVGTWPAAWLLPATNKYSPAAYGIAPSNPYAWALNGEIDFGEAIGSIPGQNIPAIHSFNEVQRAPTYSPAYIPDSQTAFHRYGVIKTPTSITFTIDGVPYNTRSKTSDDPREWPYDQPYYLVLDLALGGSWAGAHGIDDASAPWQLQIKSVTYKPL